MKKVILFIFIFFSFSKIVNGISASSAIVMDIDSNRVLYSSNIHDKRSVASISKIMTCVLAIEYGNIDEEIVIGDEIDKAYGSGIYIKKGEVVTLKDLLYGLMLRSGNDAALAIAYNISKSESDFVKLMNKKAKEIGMNNTLFHNSSGLDDNGGNISTSYDMALLTSYAMKNDIYRGIVSTKKYVLKTNMNTYIWYNKNKLLHMYDFITGGKTGFTDVAKRTLVTTGTNDNLSLVIVTLNDGNDFKDHIDLYNKFFKEYKSYSILKKGQIDIIGEKYYEYVYIKNSFRYPLLLSETDDIILKFELSKNISNGEIGKVIVKLHDDIIYEDKLYAKTVSKKDNIFKKIYKWVFRW